MTGQKIKIIQNNRFRYFGEFISQDLNTITINDIKDGKITLPKSQCAIFWEVRE